SHRAAPSGDEHPVRRPQRERRVDARAEHRGRVDGARRDARRRGEPSDEAELRRRSLSFHLSIMSHMESSTIPAAPASAPVKEQSFWEDLIDIFFSPVGVFRRRQYKSVWPPLLFVAISIGVIVFVTYSTIQPVFEAEFNRATAAQAAHNPAAAQATP